MRKHKYVRASLTVEEFLVTWYSPSSRQLNVTRPEDMDPNAVEVDRRLIRSTRKFYKMERETFMKSAELIGEEILFEDSEISPSSEKK